MNEQFLTIGPTSRLLGMSQECVRRAADRGTLKCFRTPAETGLKIRLFRREDVEAYKQKRIARAQALADALAGDGA